MVLSWGGHVDELEVVPGAAEAVRKRPVTDELERSLAHADGPHAKVERNADQRQAAQRRIADRSATATGTLCGGVMGRWGALAAIRALVTAVDDLVVRRALVKTR